MGGSRYRRARVAVAAVGLAGVMAVGPGLMPGLAGAQPVPVGSEFQVNTYTTASQFSSAVTRGAFGGYVVIWTSADAQDGDRNGVYGRRFDSGGGADPVFLVNQTTTLSQSFPDVASDPDGNFVVTWVSDLQDGDNSAVVARVYDNSGAPNSAEFIVNTVTAGNQFNPHVGVADDGTSVVVFVDSGGLDGDGRGIFARRFAALGAPLGNQFQVNAFTTYSQDNPGVAVAPDGSFLVVWTAASQNDRDGDGQAIIGRRFNTSGAASGNELIVNSYTTGNQLNATVSSGPGGDYLVVWDASGQDGSGIGVFARRFDAAGAPLGPDFQVNTFTTGLQFSGRGAFQSGGNFVISWTSRDQDGGNNGVFAHAFAGAGTPVGTEFRVNTTTAAAQDSSAIAATGSFVVTWNSDGQDGDGEGIFGQRFDFVGVTTTSLPADTCGDPNGGGITATDALILLQGAVAIGACEPCICDVDGSGTVSATDALIVLRIAVGQQVTLMCSPC
jgi:hypothetical protein